MFNIWLNLFWKEWCEHRWKLVALCVIGFAVPLYQLASEPQFVPLGVMMSLMGLSVVAPIYIGAGVAAAEKRRRTLAFLQALPAPYWYWATSKLIVGLVVLLIPLLGLLVLFLLGVGVIGPLSGLDFKGVEQGIGGDMRTVFDRFFAIELILCFLVVPNIYLWSAAAGVNRSDEIRAGALAVAAMVGYWCLLAVGYQIIRPTSNRLISVAVSTAPCGVFPLVEALQNDEAQYLLPLLGYAFPQLLINLILLGWFISRFGRNGGNVERSQRTVIPARPLAANNIRRPFRSPTSSILWMQMRELGTIAALCPVVTLGFAAVLASVTWPSADIADRLRETLPGSVCLMGLLFTTVLGAGVFLRDVEPGLNGFWRSRPASPNRWFWTKYLSGLMLWIAAIGIPVGVLALLYPVREILSTPDWQPIVLVGCAGVAIFTTSVAAMSLVRQPVYACLLSLGTVLTLLGITLIRPNAHLTSNLTLISMGLLIALAGVSTILAWLAIRNDWGWRAEG